MMAHQAPYRPVGAAGRKTARVFLENNILQYQHGLAVTGVSFQMGRFREQKKVVYYCNRTKNDS